MSLKQRVEPLALRHGGRWHAQRHAPPKVVTNVSPRQRGCTHRDVPRQECHQICPSMTFIRPESPPDVEGDAAHTKDRAKKASGQEPNLRQQPRGAAPTNLDSAATHSHKPEIKRPRNEI
jgi:hypothetical protein